MRELILFFIAPIPPGGASVFEKDCLWARILSRCGMGASWAKEMLFPKSNKIATNFKYIG